MLQDQKSKFQEDLRKAYEKSDQALAELHARLAEKDTSHERLILAIEEKGKRTEEDNHQAREMANQYEVSLNEANHRLECMSNELRDVRSAASTSLEEINTLRKQVKSLEVGRDELTRQRESLLSRYKDGCLACYLALADKGPADHFNSLPTRSLSAIWFGSALKLFMNKKL